MDKNVIKDELAICNSILEKFKEEMLDCKKDYDTLKTLEEKDGNKPEFKKAFMAVKERHDDIALSVKIIKNRIDALNAELASEE